MTPQELVEKACGVIEARAKIGLPFQDADMTLVLPPDFRAPPRWPRGEVLQVKSDGSKIVAVNVMKILSWVSFGLSELMEQINQAR